MANGDVQRVDGGAVDDGASSSEGRALDSPTPLSSHSPASPQSSTSSTIGINTGGGGGQPTTTTTISSNAAALQRLLGCLTFPTVDTTSIGVPDKIGDMPLELRLAFTQQPPPPPPTSKIAKTPLLAELEETRENRSAANGASGGGAGGYALADILDAPKASAVDETPAAAMSPLEQLRRVMMATAAAQNASAASLMPSALAVAAAAAAASANRSADFGRLSLPPPPSFGVDAALPSTISGLSITIAKTLLF